MKGKFPAGLLVYSLYDCVFIIHYFLFRLKETVSGRNLPLYCKQQEPGAAVSVKLCLSSGQLNLYSSSVQEKGSS